MDNSLSSSVNKTIIPSKDAVHQNQEESGWTSYFEDYFANKDDISLDNRSSCSSLDESPSLISDAASCAAWKINKKFANKMALSSSLDVSQEVPKKLRIKKTRIRKIIQDDHDDSLEDTASSPVDSPKVGLKLQTNGRNEMKNYDCDFNELKKKGLCLVPFSMLEKYQLY